MCRYPDCKKRSTFNKNGLKALYCSEHKLDGMVDVKNKTCFHPNCKTIPNFNIEGFKALYCSEHKLDGMINVKSKKCFHPNCKKQPAFNIEGSQLGLYCSEHKLDGMINVKSKTCHYPNCKTQPTFNIEGSQLGLYCSEHKLDGMVDIKSKRCQHENCKTQPHFNIEGEIQGLYCSIHKLNGMIDIKNKRCQHENCKTGPGFNFEGLKALYCSKHKLEGMINIKDKSCQNNWCYTLVTEKYDGYCLFCYINMFPDKPVTRNYKTKEFSVVEHVKTEFPDLSWTADKTIVGGCSKRRPDLLLDLGEQILVIEIDENQHTDYDCSCENKRIMEISQDLGHRPIVFIRFNPDDYSNEGKNITSCWGQNKQGICVVKKTKKDEWINRLDTLSEQIHYWMANHTDKTVEVVQLFYDIQ